jgi:RNA-directed DNA polymerase
MKAAPSPPNFAGMLTFQRLCEAARRAAQGKKTREVAAFLLDLEPEVLRLEEELRARRYEPRLYKTFWVYEPKPRQISAAAFRDRVVQHALCAEIEPALEQCAVGQSFACRRGKGVHAAVASARRGCQRHSHALKMDVRHFFESMHHDALKRLLWQAIQDPDLRWLCERIIDAGAPGSAAGRGLPIGNLTSQHFANFYLGPLDRYVLRAERAGWYVRYMDDLLIFGDSAQSLWGVAERVTVWAAQTLGLVMKPEVTSVQAVQEGVPFLGFRVWPGIVRLSRASALRFYRHQRALAAALDAGTCDEDYASRSAQSVNGWVSHAATRHMRRTCIEAISDQSTHTLR